MNKQEELKFLTKWLRIRQKMSEDSKLNGNILIRNIETFDDDTTRIKQEIVHITQGELK